MNKTIGGGVRRKFLANCTCCEPAIASTGPALGRRNFLAGGIAALGLGAAGSTIGAPAVRAQNSKTKMAIQKTGSSHTASKLNFFFELN